MADISRIDYFAGHALNSFLANRDESKVSISHCCQMAIETGLEMNFLLEDNKRMRGCLDSIVAKHSQNS